MIHLIFFKPAFIKEQKTLVTIELNIYLRKPNAFLEAAKAGVETAEDVFF